jgi:hypothetical protein
LDKIKAKAGKSWLIPPSDVIKHEIKKLLESDPQLFTSDEASAMKEIVGGFGSLLARSAAPGLGIVGHVILGSQKKTAETRLAELRAMMEKRNQRRCPFCAEFVRPEAIVCKHCGRDIQPDKRPSSG